jgi:hypothetical protein
MMVVSAYTPTACSSALMSYVQVDIFIYSISYGQKTHLRFQGRGVYPTEGSCRFPLIVISPASSSAKLASKCPFD